jgi:hypothetical protein
MRKLILGLAAAAAIAIPFATVVESASAATPTTTASIAVDVTSEVPTALPAMNSQFTKMVLTPRGVNHWNFGDEDHTTGYAANGVERNNTQVGGVLYRIGRGTWKALDRRTTIDGKGTVVHVEVDTND